MTILKVQVPGLRSHGAASAPGTECASPACQGSAIKKVARILQMLAVLPLLIAAGVANSETPARLTLSEDSAWRFSTGEITGAEAVGFDDQAWRTVTLPHDWSIEGSPEASNPSGGGGGFFPGGIGWYRKVILAPAQWRGRRVELEFDGVYMNSTIYLNGHELGVHPYGYSSFHFDITEALNLGAPNTLVVRVDNAQQPSSRWYSGSGIYRHVRLVVTNPIHVPEWGVYVTTPQVSPTSASVLVRTQIENHGAGVAKVLVRTTLLDATGRRVASGSLPVTLTADGGEFSQTLRIPAPSLWSPDSPTLYRAETAILRQGQVQDSAVTSFGVRKLEWSASTGLMLNGQPLKLHGGAVHGDDGPLGVMAFDRAEERKVELLKGAGFNAVRTAHNPPSPAFLDACDRLGLLVMDEAFDVWNRSKAKYDYGRFFKEWSQRDLSSIIMRDRNHPSVVLWSLGNEINEVWGPEGPPIARELSALVRSLDQSRPVTQAINGVSAGEYADAVFSSLDIGGYNYTLAHSYQADHARVPTRIMLTTESFPADAFELWDITQKHPFVVGEFVWTAMDYLGESGGGTWQFGTPERAQRAAWVDSYSREINPQLGADPDHPMAAIADGKLTKEDIGLMTGGGFPYHANYSGDIDLTGLRKPQSYYRDVLWNGGNRIFMTVHVPPPAGMQVIAIGWSTPPSLPSWSWSGEEGHVLKVDVYSAADSVRLYKDGVLLDERPAGPGQRFTASFEVPYSPGTLRAVAVSNGREIAETQLSTTQPADRLRLSSDRTAIRANEQDLAYVTVEAVDARGNLDQSNAAAVTVQLSGPGSIAGLGSGNPKSADPYQGTHVTLFGGRAIVILRSSADPGVLNLNATADGLQSTSTRVSSQATNP